MSLEGCKACPSSIAWTTVEILQSFCQQVPQQLQACCQQVCQLFQQGKDFEHEFLGIRVLSSLLQLAERLKDNGLLEGVKDMRGMPFRSLHHSYSPSIKSREARCSCATLGSGK